MDNNIWFALMITVAVIAIGLDDWRTERKKQKARAKQEASTPTDSEAEFEAKVRELREITEGKEAG